MTTTGKRQDVVFIKTLEFIYFGVGDASNLFIKMLIVTLSTATCVASLSTHLRNFFLLDHRCKQASSDDASTSRESVFSRQHAPFLHLINRFRWQVQVLCFVFRRMMHRRNNRILGSSSDGESEAVGGDALQMQPSLGWHRTG